MTPAQQLGVRLAAARHAAGLSQRQVAAALGIHQPSIVVIENGRRTVTALELAAMARLYRVSTDDLLALAEQVKRAA
jgi:transcriptional regulator with XRE-family HTH domain